MKVVGVGVAGRRQAGRRYYRRCYATCALVQLYKTGIVACGVPTRFTDMGQLFLVRSPSLSMSLRVSVDLSVPFFFPPSRSHALPLLVSFAPSVPHSPRTSFQCSHWSAQDELHSFILHIMTDAVAQTDAQVHANARTRTCRHTQTVAHA